MEKILDKKTQENWVLKMEEEYGLFVSIRASKQTLDFQKNNHLYTVKFGKDAIKWKLSHPISSFKKNNQDENLTVVFAKDWDDAMKQVESIAKKEEK